MYGRSNSGMQNNSYVIEQHVQNYYHPKLVNLLGILINLDLILINFGIFMFTFIKSPNALIRMSYLHAFSACVLDSIIFNDKIGVMMQPNLSERERGGGVASAKKSSSYLFLQTVLKLVYQYNFPPASKQIFTFLHIFFTLGEPQFPCGFYMAHCR